MEIKLHLGAHRCASTTLQGYLWANRVALAKNGVTCWTPQRTRDGLMRGMIRHPERISVEDERRAMRSVGRMRIEIERLKRCGQSALLISEENIIGSTRQNIRNKVLYPLLEERLLRFVPTFEGHQLQIGFSIRSYEDYWASSWAYALYCGGRRPTTDDLDMLTTQTRRWRDLVRDVASCFPQADIFVYPFERYAQQPNAVLDAFCPDTSHRLPKDFRARNRSRNVGQLNAMMLMRGEPQFDVGPGGEDRRWMPFDEHQRAVLRAEYRRDLTWLKAGAEGLARYVDGRKTPVFASDRALEKTSADHLDLVVMKGQLNGIEKRLEQPRTG